MQGHTDEVWALAISPDGRHLASGGKDRIVGVWDVDKDEWVKGFTGHRDHISVRPSSHLCLPTSLIHPPGARVPKSTTQRNNVDAAILSIIRPDAEAV